MLNKGDTAPDFELPLPNGQIFKLSSVLKFKNVVLYFYPKDETRGCTVQACEFQEQYTVFQQYNTEVIGISSDSHQSHNLFAQNHGLTFTLLSDENGKIRRLYQVPKTLGLIAGRVTFLIDQQRIIQYVFNSQLKPLEHICNTLEVLKSLYGKAGS